MRGDYKSVLSKPKEANKIGRLGRYQLSVKPNNRPIYWLICFFTTETCCEHTKHTGIPFTSCKIGNGPTVLENWILCQLFSVLLKTFWETMLPRNGEKKQY